eukprot:gnl/MRDRNA2_/MRDRNA2_31470_c0_seq1.p1 gnl/MRDRNA2_/MRDRNA2_31470_c0~~gnl/MRDRNA2_/MRDRNA2_31470_c0_seq1.p1  ORF type:complete len:233 (+),score=59.40 gnl/MRDRNA2_/MRDRNA2_31470_c0_seq1:55-699(+)
MTCDSCSIIAQSVVGALLFYETKYKRPLEGPQIEQVIDSVCAPGTTGYFAKTGYRGKLVEGTIRVDGPGSFAADEEGQHVGDATDIDLSGSCSSLVAEFPMIYGELQDRVARQRPKVDPKKTAAGVKDLVQEICMKPDKNQKKEPKGGRVGVKDKQGNIIGPGGKKIISQSCGKKRFFFDVEAWTEVLQKVKKSLPKTLKGESSLDIKVAKPEL